MFLLAPSFVTIALAWFHGEASNKKNGLYNIVIKIPFFTNSFSGSLAQVSIAFRPMILPVFSFPFLKKVYVVAYHQNFRNPIF